MAWMIPIIGNGRNRCGRHRISGVISILLLFLGLGIFLLSLFGYSKFDGFMTTTTWIMGGIIFLIFIFVIIGIIAAVASVNSEKVKINGYKQNRNEFERLNPYIIRKPSQNHLEEIFHERSEKNIPTPHEIQFCRYCGAKLEKNANFCQECGMKVEK
ncbi:MAG: zinc ribbon domain-containing protein [Promethearchaeota archaeon]